MMRYSPFFSNKKAMVIVPHMDDELNVAAVAMRNYQLMGSRVQVVFTTTGDIYDCPGWAARRRKEALRTLKLLGIGEKDILFLNYPSSRCENKNPHSYPQLTRTEAGMWREIAGRLSEILIEALPDVIYTTDHDIHSDHKCTSLAVEKAVLTAIRRVYGYAPRLYKSLSYACCWNGNRDFYDGINLKPAARPSKRELYYYSWDERLSLPYLSSGDVGYTMRGCMLYSLYKNYKSQNVLSHLCRIINSDQVFFEMRTDNLLLKAALKVSSGEKEKLERLSRNELFRKHTANGLFRFESADSEKSIELKWRESVELDEIRIYTPLEEKTSYQVRVKGREERCFENNGENPYIIKNLGERTDQFSFSFSHTGGLSINYIELLSNRNEEHEFYKLALAGRDREYIYNYITDQDAVEIACLDPHGTECDLSGFQVNICNQKGIERPYELLDDRIIKLYRTDKKEEIVCRIYREGALCDQIRIKGMDRGGLLRILFLRRREMLAEEFMKRIRHRIYGMTMKYLSCKSIWQYCRKIGGNHENR